MVSKKNSHRRLCLISLATDMLEIIHWIGGVHSFVWSTKTFLYDIWEPRYKQIIMRYQISKCLNIGKSSDSFRIQNMYGTSFSGSKNWQNMSVFGCPPRLWHNGGMNDMPVPSPSRPPPSTSAFYTPCPPPTWKCTPFHPPNVQTSYLNDAQLFFN